MMDSEYLVASSTTVRSYEKNALAFFKFPMFIVPSVNINGFAEAVNLTDARGNPVKWNSVITVRRVFLEESFEFGKHFPYL